MDLRRMSILVEVVERGSMRLERETGVTLLRRSTRKLALTRRPTAR